MTDIPLISDPSAYLPHRYPFLMLDRLVAREPGICARAFTRVSGVTPSFPPLLLVECVAQLAGIATAATEGETGFLAAIDRACFTGEAPTGATLEVSVRVVKSFGRLHLVEGEVSADGERILEVALTMGTGSL
jgi:3-hydroxyacyl-[acyl-carrier-protein] dehydratase